MTNVACAAGRDRARVGAAASGRAEAIGLDPPPGLSKFRAAATDAPLPLVCKKKSPVRFEGWVDGMLSRAGRRAACHATY